MRKTMLLIMCLSCLSLFGCGGGGPSAPVGSQGHGATPLAWTAALASVASDPDVQVPPSGQALAVWWQYNADQSGSTIEALLMNQGATPVRISAGAGYATSPRIAFDASGDAIAVWVQYDNSRNNVWANRYTPASGWGSPVMLTDVSAANAASSPSLGVDGAGNAVVTWGQENAAVNSNHFDIYASRYTAATGSWSAPAMVSNGVNSAYGSKVAVNTAGAMALIWVQMEDDGSTSNGPADVWGVTGSSTAGWGAPVKVSSVPGSQQEVYGQTAVAIDAAGDVLAAWVQANGFGLFDIWASHLSAGHQWESPVTVSAGTVGECYGPDLAFDGSGNAMLVWEQQSAATSSQYVAASRFTAGAGWSTPVRISQDPGDTFDQHVAVDASGNATVVWYQVPQGAAVTVRSNRYLPATGWGTTQLIATTTTDGYTVYPVPRVGMNASGQSVVVWGTDSN